MSLNFFPSYRRSPILDFDEHELATLIYGTFPAEVAELARDFIVELKISGAQFMQLGDEKLHILANDNVDALHALRNLRQSPPECILALMFSNRPSPAIPPDFRKVVPFIRQKGVVVANVDDWTAHDSDDPPTASNDLAEWNDYEAFGFNDDHKPSSIKPTSNMPRSSIWSDEEPPASGDSYNPSEIPLPSGASKSLISLNPELIVTCQPTSSVISAKKTSSKSRNTSEGPLPIKDEISTDGQIVYHRVRVRHLNDDVGRSRHVLQPSGVDERVSDSANADMVFLSPSSVKSTFNYREIDNVVSITSTAPTMISLVIPADGGKDIEERLEHPPAHTSSISDQNNLHDNNPIGRDPKMTSPTKHGSCGTFSETTLPCLVDRGRSPNLRSLTAGHEQASILPQMHILSFNDAASTYGPDADEDSDPGVSEEMPPSSIDHRDFGSARNLSMEDRNLQTGRSRLPNFAPHIVGFAGDLSTTIVSGAISSSSRSLPASTHSGLSTQSPSDAPPFAHLMTDDAPIFRHTDVGMPIKLAVHDDNSTNPSNEGQLATTTITLPSTAVWSSNDERSHTCAPLSDSQRSSILESPLVPSSQTFENLANTSDQTPPPLTARRSANSFLAHPHSRDATTAECLSEQDHSVISDTSVSPAQSVIIHHEDKLLMIPASWPASPSRESIPSFCDLGNFFSARTLRGSLPACHQPSMFLPADNSGYLVSNIDSHIHGSSPGSRSENTLALNQDTRPGLEALDGGAKQARYSQTQVDVGTVPELRLPDDVHVLPEHVEKFEAPYSNTFPAADWTAHDDAQVSKFANWKTYFEINEIVLPRIPLSPSFSQEMSSSLESLSVDRSANLRQTTADATPMAKPPRSPRRAARAMPRTLWPISDGLPGESQMPAMSYGKGRPMKRHSKSLSLSSLANVQAGKAKSATSLTYSDAATQTELKCQRTLLKIQADDQRRELPISSSTSLPDTPSFLGGVHKILAGILPNVTAKETPKPLPTNDPRPRVDITSRGLLPSSQGPMNALSKVSGV